MSELRLPQLSAGSARLQRSALRWMHRSGDTIQAREPIAACYVRLSAPGGDGRRLPLQEEQNDLQIVLAPSSECTVTISEAASKGGYQDFVSGSSWRAGENIAQAQSSRESPLLQPLLLVGRRGFESGEGRGGMLAGWHERVRGFWEGGGAAIDRVGTVLALGTCEQTAIFRGDDMAFLSWFRRAPGPAQIVSVSDERCVHSSAVLLQHVRRTPAEAAAITSAVYEWIGEHIGHDPSADYPAFQPQSARGTLQGRWPKGQDLLFALQLLAEAVGTSPILERSEVITSRGIKELSPPDAVALTLGGEFSPHFRHRRTGWIVAMHGFRFGPFIGPGIIDWLRRDFEPLDRTIEHSERDLTALADEVQARTGATLIVQNLISSTVLERVSNYSWLGDTFFDESIPVRSNEANLMLSDLTRNHSIAAFDSDALAAEFGVKECPDRFHASGRLVNAQRTEIHRILREIAVPGF